MSVALAAICLCPLIASAEEDGGFDLDGPAAATPASKPVLVNEAGVGVGGQTGGVGRFGRYSGGPEDGPFGSAWFRTRQRATGKDDGTFFFEAEGDDLTVGRQRVLADPTLSFRAGEQGVWDGRVSYEGIAFREAADYHTLFGSGGELLNGLTPRSINTTASNAAGAARVNKYLSTVDIGTRRKRLDGEFRLFDVAGWTPSAKVEHEHKEGTKINSLFFYNANVFASIPEPVSYDTDRLTVMTDYATSKVQARLSYVFSSFTNNQASFKTVTPFNAATIPGYQASELSLPPSNQEHRVKAQFGFSPLASTHIATNLSYGLQLQNEAFTGRIYERTPKLTDSAYDGLITTMYGNVTLTSRPWTDWNFRAAYTFDDRDNDSAAYKQPPPYRADGTAAFNGSVGVQYNRPYSFRNQRADLEAGYRLTRSTKATLDYGYSVKERDYSVTDRNREITTGGRLNSTLADGVIGSLGYSHATRQATEYDGNAGWASLGRNLTGNNSEKDLRMYTYAARERDEIKSTLTWDAGPGLSVGATGRLIKDEFPDTFFGVTENKAASIGPDITFTPMKGMTAHLYYTYQTNFTDMVVANPQNGNSVNWRLRNTDTVQTVGFHTDWQVTDRLKLQLEDNLSYGNTAFEEASWARGTGATSAANSATSLPDNKSIINSLRVTGEYGVTDNMYVGVVGLWERFVGEDYLNWQAASSSANQTGTAVLGAEGSGTYSAHVIMATARVVW
ncbi:hypothetical protein N825_23915 [Skermanella stibiiresistens SB22]|uniref:MtrB/PioB family decaheme-associated outer membrane protein n=1 Tax=Skermanella stibiiresistens SB22 TaxID=1385369 RepID=W9HD52_9PROT|nr:hypothetical protein N825_23915 [Skermanella stibiiresistens SB22]